MNHHLKLAYEYGADIAAQDFARKEAGLWPWSRKPKAQTPDYEAPDAYAERTGTEWYEADPVMNKILTELTAINQRGTTPEGLQIPLPEDQARYHTLFAEFEKQTPIRAESMGVHPEWAGMYTPTSFYDKQAQETYFAIPLRNAYPIHDASVSAGQGTQGITLKIS